MLALPLAELLPAELLLAGLLLVGLLPAGLLLPEPLPLEPVGLLLAEPVLLLAELLLAALLPAALWPTWMPAWQPQLALLHLLPLVPPYAPQPVLLAARSSAEMPAASLKSSAPRSVASAGLPH